MKVRPSVKPMCEKCKIIKRHGKVMVICENPKHKLRQGCASLAPHRGASRRGTAEKTVYSNPQVPVLYATAPRITEAPSGGIKFPLWSSDKLNRGENHRKE